jgi:Uma2 family endonuclease
VTAALSSPLSLPSTNRSAIVDAMAGDPARKPATYDDVLAAPEGKVAEVIRGALTVMPRPRPTHANTASRLGMRLARFGDPDEGDPGGWIILDEPELHLGDDIVVPDLVGWRRARMPELPTDLAYFVLAPDWCCEVLSPGTEAMDRGEKLEIYAENGVGHYWLVNPDLHTIEVLRLDGSSYRIVRVFRGNDPARVEPFEAIELPLERLWKR